MLADVVAGIILWVALVVVVVSLLRIARGVHRIAKAQELVAGAVCLEHAVRTGTITTDEAVQFTVPDAPPEDMR